jgi:hypothetical protein
MRCSVGPCGRLSGLLGKQRFPFAEGGRNEAPFWHSGSRGEGSNPVPLPPLDWPAQRFLQTISMAISPNIRGHFQVKLRISILWINYQISKLLEVLGCDPTYRIRREKVAYGEALLDVFPGSAGCHIRGELEACGSGIDARWHRDEAPVKRRKARRYRCARALER